MDDYLEIDLRKYIKLILSKWYWIVGPALVLGLAVFVYYSFFVPDLYQVDQQVIISTSNLFSRLVPDKLFIEPEVAIPPNRFAMSNQTITKLSERWDYEESETYSENAIRGFLSFENVEDQYYKLSAEFEDPEAAVSLVNLWAEVFVEAYNSEINQFYENFLQRLTTQLSEKKTELDEAQQEYFDFQLSDPRELLKDQLNSAKEEQSTNFAQQRKLRNIKLDIAIMQDQLIGQPENVKVDDSLRVTYVLLQSQLVGGASGVSLDVPIEFSQEEPMTVGDLRTALSGLNAIIDNQLELLKNAEEDYISIIKQLWSEIRYYDYQEKNILYDISNYEESYKALLKNLEDFELATGNLFSGSGYVEIDPYFTNGRATKLEDNALRNTLIAVVAGGFLGIAGILIAHWWQAEQEVDREE